MIYWKMFVATLMAMVNLVVSPSATVKKNKDICMIAHRGYSGIYYQNTDLAFKKAAEHGSGGAETDIRMTKDGVYVCSHDSEVTFKDGTTLKVADATYEELIAKPLKIKLGFYDVRLCTLERYLEIMRDNNMVCFVELKGEFNDEQLSEIFGMVERVYDLSKCIMQSFNFDNLVRTHNMFPDLPLMLTYGEGDEGYERCFDYGFEIDCDYKVLTQEMVEQFHQRGLKVAAWTANDVFSLNYCRSLGVDYIESDYFGG